MNENCHGACSKSKQNFILCVLSIIILDELLAEMVPFSWLLLKAIKTFVDITIKTTLSELDGKTKNTFVYWGKKERWLSSIKYAVRYAHKPLKETYNCKLLRTG